MTVYCHSIRRYQKNVSLTTDFLCFEHFLFTKMYDIKQFVCIMYRMNLYSLTTIYDVYLHWYEWLPLREILWKNFVMWSYFEIMTAKKHCALFAHGNALMRTIKYSAYTEQLCVCVNCGTFMGKTWQTDEHTHIFARLKYSLTHIHEYTIHVRTHTHMPCSQTRNKKKIILFSGHLFVHRRHKHPIKLEYFGQKVVTDNKIWKLGIL